MFFQFPAVLLKPTTRVTRDHWFHQFPLRSSALATDSGYDAVVGDRMKEIQLELYQLDEEAAMLSPEASSNGAMA